MKIRLQIIAISYNSASVLDRFLASIPDGIHTIIIDNASMDESPAVARRHGAEVIRLDRNVGYGAACNVGAAAAKNADLLLFANPDIAFAQGAVEALIESAKNYPDAAFNPRIYEGKRRRFRSWSRLLPKEEFWSGSPPEDDAVIPVLSGACMLVRKMHFDAIGGFDPEIFLFHEDDDLSLRLRQSGVKLRLSAGAVIYHSAGRSSPRSPRTGRIKGVAMGRSLVHVMRKHGFPFDVAAERRKTRLKLFLPHVMFNGPRRAKHLGFLEGLSQNSGRRRLFSMRRIRRRMYEAVFRIGCALGFKPKSVAFARGERPVVLLVDRVYPRPDRDSGSLDALAFVRIFQDLGYRVLFAADVEFAQDSPYRAQLESLGVECIAADRFWSLDHFLYEHGKRVDLFFLSRVEAGGRFIERIRRTAHAGAKVIFNLVDLGSLRELRRAELEKKERLRHRADRTRRRERAVIEAADATIVVSYEEERILREAIPGARIFILPLIRDVPGRAGGFEARSDIGFIGGYAHRPNVDAVTCFLNEIWPLVRARLADAEFIAMGADMPNSISSRRDSRFVPLGYVDNLTPYLEKIRIMVAPLRYGAGAKGKIVTSLANGIPCVATSIAAEGMALQDGVNILLADNPEEFCERIVRLYSDENLWNRISDQGLDLVRREHSFERGSERLSAILKEIDVRSAV